MFRLTSLKQKIAVLIILPLCLVMLIAGAVGIRLIGGILLSQWEETAISKMERSAHEVDMRLMRPKGILSFFLQNRASQGLQADGDILIQQLKAIDGVVGVISESFNSQGKNRMHRMGRLQNTSVSPLSYNSKLDSQTVSIVAQFGESTSARESYIEVVISFSDLINQIVKAPWWQGNKAFILVVF